MKHTPFTPDPYAWLPIALQYVVLGWIITAAIF
jgi:hypothetical protein